MYPIPANATRIRYLESTGTQYINTGVPFGEMDVRARVNFMYWSTPGGGTKMILGSGVGSNRGFVISTALSNGAQVWNLGIGANNFGGSVVGNTWYDVQASIRSTGSTLTVDGTTVVSSSAYSNFNGISLFIFARNNNGTADLLEVSAPARVASLDMSVSGTLVRSYVPVRVGQTGYLFDRVSGQLFGNSGTGDFVLGPDTFSQGVVPTRMMVAGVRKKPYDAEVEWLVNGTIINQVGDIACVDTGIDSGDNVGFEVDVTRVNETTSDSVIFGSRYSSGDTRYFIGAQVGGKYYWGWNGRIDSQTLTLNAKHTLGLNYLNSRKATFDGTQVGSLSGTYTNAKRLYFCAYNTKEGSIGGGSSWRCHGGRISVGSTIVRRYKPVRIGTTGYWYEEISGTLHASKAGAFAVGPDKT